MKRVLVCGGRNYRNRARVSAVLSAVHRKHGISAIIQGAAAGADEYAVYWAFDNDVRCCSFPADWETHGKKAGVLRNLRMLEEGKPDVVIAFPGGKGTAHMIEVARKAGVFVWEIDK